MTSVETIDFDQVFGEIAERLKRDQERRIKPPLTRIWDADGVFIGEVHNEISAKFTLPENETGIGTIELPARYYLSKWLTNHDDRSTDNVIITVDKDGARWSGMLDDLEQYKTEDGQRIVKATFKSDFEHLKHILAYSNPFLPPEIQFPRLWILFGPAKWALKLTLFVNLLRLQGLDGLWTLPDDPMNPDGWLDLDQSNWAHVVAPIAIENDNSQFAIVHSRWKYFFDVQKRITADAQLTWEPRRYLEGDPPPWPGASLRPGTIVWDLVDNSGWDTETSFGGNLFTGLVRAVTNIGSDGMTEGIDVINDPTFPPEYEIPGWKGTVPRAPGIILRDGDRTGIQSNSFHWKPATDTEFATGGHSMPGVNELISATINMVGDLIAAALFVPPVGGMADALLKPLYCVAGDTVIEGPDGDERIDALAERGGSFRVWSLTPTGKRVAARADFAFKKGSAELFEYTLANGRTLTATAHHRWLTRAGWMEAKETPIGTEVATVNHSRARVANVLTPPQDLRDEVWVGVGDSAAVEYSAVVSVRSVGVQDFYDMHVPGWVNYSGNGIWSHNTDVFLAFMKWQDIGRAQKLGWQHYFETWCEGSDRAYTLSALIALRTGMWRTREQTTHSVTVSDGVEGLLIGQNGYGNAWLGTRIGTTVKDWGKPGRVYVDRITELVLAWDRNTTPMWTLTVGHREPEDPVMAALEMLQEISSIARDLGVA